MRRYRDVLIAVATVLAAVDDNAVLAQVTRSQLSAAANAVDFQRFWERFRQAVMNNDAAAIEAMVAFPFRIKGELDDDPVKTIDKPAFSRFFRASLRERAYMRHFNGSTLDFLRANPVFPKIELDGDGAQRIGNLLFQQRSDGWRLTMIYRSEDD